VSCGGIASLLVVPRAADIRAGDPSDDTEPRPGTGAGADMIERMEGRSDSLPLGAACAGEEGCAIEEIDVLAVDEPVVGTPRPRLSPSTRPLPSAALTPPLVVVANLDFVSSPVFESRIRVFSAFSLCSESLGSAGPVMAVAASASMAKRPIARWERGQRCPCHERA
jgi:hypothetical protein